MKVDQITVDMHGVPNTMTCVEIEKKNTDVIFVTYKDTKIRLYGGHSSIIVESDDNIGISTDKPSFRTIQGDLFAVRAIPYNPLHNAK